MLVYASTLAIPLTQLLYVLLKRRGKGSAAGNLPSLSFLTLNLVSWGFWLASVLYVSPFTRSFLVAVLRLDISALHVGSLVTSIVGEVLMVKSLLTLDSEREDASLDSTPATPSDVRRKERFISVVILGTFLSFLGGGLLVYASIFCPSAANRPLYFFLAGVCALVGANTTHGLGGAFLWHRHKPPTTAAAHTNGSATAVSKGGDRSRSPSAPPSGPPASAATPLSWHFWQPFRGGKVFVSVQALGWALFGISLSGLLRLLYSPSGRIAIATALTLVLAQSFIAASLRFFKPESETAAAATEGPPRPADYIPEGLDHPPTLWDKANATLLMALLYLPIHIVVAFYVLTYTLLPFKYFCAVQLAWKVPYFVFSGALAFRQTRMDPYHTGSRQWPAVQRWATKYTQLMADLWLGGGKVVYDGTGPLALPPGCDRVIFGFHPHGLYPVAAGLLPFFPAFQRLLPAPMSRPITLTADAMYYPPLLRDVMGWAGARRVSRSTFRKALHEHKGVVMVPGGQQELVYAYRAHRKKDPEIVICTKHRGFVRMALENNAALVPCICFNEIHGLWNAIEWPSMQEWSFRKVGFPIPFLLTGRWFLSFVPKPYTHPVTFVLGEPILPPSVCPSIPPTPAKDGQATHITSTSVVGPFPLATVGSLLDPSPGPTPSSTPVKRRGPGEKAGADSSASSEPSTPLNNGNARAAAAQDKGVAASVAVTEELVEKYHALYFKRVEELWHKYSEQCGNGHIKIRFLHK